jgi:hypothetical protein
MDQTIQGNGNVTAGGNVTINVFIIAPAGFKKNAGQALVRRLKKNRTLQSV